MQGHGFHCYILEHKVCIVPTEERVYRGHQRGQYVTASVTVCVCMCVRVFIK